MSVGVCASLGLLAPTTSAQQPPAAAAGPKRAAVLLFSGCGVEGAPPRAVSDVLSLELGAANVRLKGEDEGFGAGDLLLVVRGGCEASEPLTLRASVDGTQRERSLLLDDVPDSARARTLALSLAELGELVISGDPPQAAVPPAATAATAADAPKAEPETAVEKPPAAARPKPETAPKQTSPKPAPPVVPERERQQLFAEPKETETVRRSEFLTLSLANRWFGLEQATWGGRGRVDIAPAFFGGEALYGQATSNIGSVRGLVADGFVGVRLLSLAKTRLVSIDAGPRAGAGVVHVYGAPQGGATSSDTFEMYLDAAVVCDTRLYFADVFSASLSVELGAARGVVALADGARVSEFGGFFMGVTLGLGFGL
jgi:hypothetical protein